MLKLDWHIIWNIVNILVLFLFMKKFLFKPVTAMMEKRTQTIQDSFDEAEAKKAEADRLKEQYEAEISTANAEAKRIIQASREKANQEYYKRLEELEDEKAKMIKEATAEIELERQNSIREAQQEIATMAVLAASRIIGKNIEDGNIGADGISKAYTVRSVENVDGNIQVKAQQILYLEDRIVIPDATDATKSQVVNYNAAGEIL